MRKIKPNLVEEILADPYYRQCCVSGKSKFEVKIEWHHNLIFAGVQVNRKFCILPLAQEVHKDIVKYQSLVDWIMLNRADEVELKVYSKAVDLFQYKDYLDELYGEYSHENIKKHYEAIKNHE